MKKILLAALAAIILGNGGYLLYNGTATAENTTNLNSTITASETTLNAAKQTKPEITAELPDAIQLDVPLILQKPQLPTGCEIVSATMLLRYNGINMDATQLALEIPYDEEDPNLGFVGDPFTEDGWTIYPQALAETLAQYLPTAYDLTGATLDELKQQLADSNPVVVWLSGLHGFTLHSVLVTGYDENGITYNDPWTGEKNAWISTEEFMERWAAQDYRALSC